MVEQLSVDVKNCLTFATRVARNEDAMARQESNVASLREKAEKTGDGLEIEKADETLPNLERDDAGIHYLTARGRRFPSCVPS
eukprot:1809179-Amphidinium_carterae.1